MRACALKIPPILMRPSTLSLVIIALWHHPFPSRTRKWNATAPMVVWFCHARVGHRQGLYPNPRSSWIGGFLCVLWCDENANMNSKWRDWFYLSIWYLWILYRYYRYMNWVKMRLQNIKLMLSFHYGCPTSQLVRMLLNLVAISKNSSLYQ